MTQAATVFELEANIPVASNPETMNREATRWIWWPGDIITPAAKRIRPDLKLGGEYLGQDYKTLVRSRGLLRRCQLTPMEVGFDFLNDDLIGGEEGLIVRVVADDSTGLPEGIIPQLTKALNAVRVYPGDEIKGLLRGRYNDTSKGEVEITKLAGHTFDDVQQAGLQEFIFPQWKEVMAGAATLPVQLSGIVKHLEGRLAEISDDSLKDIISEMLESCETYKRWGTEYLKTATQLVNAPITHGFVHTYSPQAEMLFDQLEIRREDLIRREQDIADIVERVNAGNSVSNDDMKALLTKMTDAFSMLAQQQFVKDAPPGTARKRRGVSEESEKLSG